MSHEKLVEEFMKRVKCLALEVPAAVYQDFRDWAYKASQALREMGEEITRLKGELEEARRQIEGCNTAWCDPIRKAHAETGAANGRAYKIAVTASRRKAERDRLKGELEKIAYNISLSMPAAHGDEVAWYRGQAQAAIGTAARALAQSLNPKEPKEGGE